MRILLVEDNPADAELISELLSEYPQYSFSVRHELSLGSARTALDDGGTDFILLDLGLPDSQGMETVRELRAAAQGIPIVVLTGLDDEDVGIRTLHEGAQDYLAKGWMNGPTLIRSIRYAEERNRIREELTRKNAELAASKEELRESEEKFRLLADFTADWESWTGPDGGCIYVSPSCERISGRSAGEFYRDPELFATLVHPDDRAAYEEHLDLHLKREGGRESIDLRIVTAGGEIRWISHHCQPISGRDGSWLGRRISNREITGRKLAEEALRRSEANMAHAQRTAHLGNWEWDPKKNVFSCSDEHCRIYGLSPGDYPLETFVDLVHEDDRQYVMDSMAPMIHEGKAFDVECRVVRTDGSVRVVHAEGMAIRDSAGSVTSFFGIAQDITERKLAEDALRETRDFLDSVINHANAPIIVWDPDHRIMRFNAAFEHMSGYAADEVIGRNLSMLFPEESREESLEKIQRTISEYWESVEIPILRPDGEIRVALWNSANIHDSEGTTLLATIAQGQDITERKEAELRIARYADELARSNEELQRFAYVASHDLQEPLRSIISFSQLLERRYRGRLDEDADDYIQFIVEGGTRMQALIHDLLQISRVETNARPLEPTDAGEVVGGALRLLETLIREAGATVAVGLMPRVLADGAQLEQVFANLVGNAIKYRRPDLPPEVRITARRADELWRFAVADNGIGIEPEYFDRIFEMFRRLHTREAYEGTGIGLAVVRKIVERHGGRIWVESTPGEGSTFFFTLPAA